MRSDRLKGEGRGGFKHPRDHGMSPDMPSHPTCDS